MCKYKIRMETDTHVAYSCSWGENRKTCERIVKTINQEHPEYKCTIEPLWEERDVFCVLSMLVLLGFAIFVTLYFK